MFVPGKLFQTSLMFVSKAGAYLREAPFRCSIIGLALALPQNIRLAKEKQSSLHVRSVSNVEKKVLKH
jgi:hypothetical protein